MSQRDVTITTCDHCGEEEEMETPPGWTYNEDSDEDLCRFCTEQPKAFANGCQYHTPNADVPHPETPEDAS